jgi:GDPmannose 4,6-dehydratase
MSKVAIIVGSSGQDGTLLTEKLKHLDYCVIGVGRGDIDISNADEVEKLIIESQPDEVYYLAAHHHSSEVYINNETELFKKSMDVQAIAVVNFLDAIYRCKNNCRFFYASSCLIFKGSIDIPISENSSYCPESFYAISKVTGGSVVKFYRENKDIFASCGFLFNHESSLRSERFLSKKITSFVASIITGHETGKKLTLGDLNTKVDWGYAKDYVDAFWRILQVKKPDDYIIATGILHSVRDFVDIAFSCVGLDYSNYIKVDSKIISRNNNSRVGVPTKLKTDTNWETTLDFEEMVIKLVQTEIYNMDK